MAIRLFLAVLGLLSVAFAQRLEPGDRIRLICEQEPTLSVERTLSPDGFADLPLLGRVLLGGRTIPEAEGVLERLAMGKLHSDEVLIAITLQKDLTGPVLFAGAVTRSGSAPFRAGMTLKDVVRLAEPVAAEMTAVEITGSDGKKLIINAESGGGETLLHPGDSIFFPRSSGPSDVLILGGVSRPGSKEFYPGMTLRDLVKVAEGVTAHGIADQIKLERKGEPARVIDLNSAEADIKLVRGDTVTVPVVENPKYVSVSGMVAKQGLIDFHPGLTLREAIDAAGGVAPFGSPEHIVVKRLGQWKRNFSLNEMAAGKAPMLVLEPGDMIEVPAGKWKSAPRAGSQPKSKPKNGPVVPP